MNAELKTIMARLDEVQGIFDETCKTNATLAATAIDELRSTLAEAVETINACLKKIRSDAHKGIIANRKFLTGYVDDALRKMSDQRKCFGEKLGTAIHAQGERLDAAITKTQTDAAEYVDTAAGHAAKARDLDRHHAIKFTESLQEKLSIRITAVHDRSEKRSDELDAKMDSQIAALAKRLDSLADQVDENAPHS